jgi:acyl-CoA thioesterase-1
MRWMLVIVGLLAAEPAAAVTLPERGNVVFLGDSITWQNLYVGYVEAFLVRAFPERQLTMINHGVRGDTVADVLARVDDDVVPHDPALVVIMLGMNDGGFGPPSGILLSRYLRGMERLIEALRARTKAQLLLMTPTCVTPIDADHRTYNEMLAVMSRELIVLGTKHRVEVLDVHTRFVADFRPELMADPLHPGPKGHALVARWLLEVLVGRDFAKIEKGLSSGAALVGPSLPQPDDRGR